MLIAGPCAVESKEQAFKIAKFVKENGATHFRGGAYKGQNRPFVNGKPEFRGLGPRGVEILGEVQKSLGLPCVCDAQSMEQVQEIYGEDIDYLMVGARNMDNLAFLRTIKVIFDFKNITKKIILKRGPSATVDEWIGAAEHLGGPERVILCSRGTVHFDRHDYTRFRLDLVGMAEVKRYHPDYKLIVDPSHGSGNRKLVYLLSKAALAIADGLMVEVHYDPDSSPTDAPQTVSFNEFKKIAELYKSLQ